MANIIGVGRTCVRYLIGKSPALLGKEWLANPISLLRALDVLKPASYPKGHGDWLTLRKFWDGCGLDENCIRSNSTFLCSTDQLMVHVFSGLCASGYAITDRKLTARWEGEFGRLRDLNDYFFFIAQWCEAGAGLGPLNAHVRELAERMLSVELLKRYSAKGLIKQSEHWHRLLPQCSAEVLAEQSATLFWEWPALPGLPWHHNSLSAVALTTPRFLVQEGKQLNHCIAGNAESCLSGLSHIISIVDHADGSRSTGVAIKQWSVINPAYPPP